MATLSTILLNLQRNFTKLTSTMTKSWFLLTWYRYSQRFLLTEHVNIFATNLSKDTTLKHRTKLSIDDIIKLLRFTLSNSFFNYNKQTYKQIHGCAMGSPVIPIVANHSMEEIEELAHSQSTSPPKKWFRHVDDTFSIIKKHGCVNHFL